MVGGVGFVARAQIRRRWLALALLAVVVGVVGGLSISLIAGADRSTTVVDRFFAVARHYDAQVYDPASELTQRDLLGVRGVRRADPSSYVGMMATGRDGEPIDGINGAAVDWSARDPTIRLVDGAIPKGSDPTEVVVNETFVDQFGRSVGDTIDARTFGLEQRDDVGNGIYQPTGPRYRFRIAGVIRTPQDITLDEVYRRTGSAYGSANLMAVSNQFYETHRHDFLDFGGEYNVVLDGASHTRQRVAAAVRALTPADAEPPQVLPFEDRTHRASLETPVDLETTALLALGFGLALAGAIVVALILRAEQRVYDADTPTLRALGCSASQLASVAMLRVLPAALGGTALALGVAFALSSRFPIGIGRQLELDRGFEANAAVLGIGAFVSVGFILGCSFLFGRPRRAREAQPKQSSLTSRLGRVGAPVSLALGSYLAFARSRRSRSVPARQAIAGGAAMLAIVVGLGLYLSGVDTVYSTPAAHGWVWDAAVGNVNFPLSETTAADLARDDTVRAQTKASYGQATVDKMSTEFLAFDAEGSAPPEVTAGRLPRTGGEVALGAGFMDRLRVHLGSTVTFSVADGEFDTGGRDHARRLMVVGEALAPVFGESDASDIGIVTLDAIAAAGGDASPKLVFVLFQAGDRAAQLAGLDRRYTEEITTDTIPAQVVNLHRVRDLPVLGLALAGLLGLVLLAYVMAVSARVRMRDLAILRALGLPARRLRSVLTWESAIVAVGMLLIGVPVGILAGSALWVRATDSLGIDRDAPVPALLVLIVPLALVAVLGTSLVSARRARRAQVAEILRAY